VSTQLGAQFAYPFPVGGPAAPFAGGGSILDTTARVLVTPAGSLRIGQGLYIIIDAENFGAGDREVWVMPWWLHPTFEYRYPGQGQYTADDLANFGVQNVNIALQDSLWMTSPKRFDIVGAPSPVGTSISDMQSDVWAINIPALSRVKKSFFYPSHGYALAVTFQIYDAQEPGLDEVTFSVSVTPGATHAVFQDGQG